MGADASKEQEERMKAEEERKKEEQKTKQKELDLQMEASKERQQLNAALYDVVKREQETQQNLALNKKFCVIHGGVSVAKNGTPRLNQTILVSDTEQGLEVCYNLFYLNNRKKAKKTASFKQHLCN